MLRRLRIKFICVNMGIVAAMLAVIFGLELHFTRQDLEGESLRQLQLVAERLDRPREEGEGPRERPLTEPENADTYVPVQKLVSLSLQEVLAVSRQTEGSVSGVLSLIMARAVDRMNGDASACIVVKCPINLRPMLGCTETMQNCVSSVHYVYSQKLKKMPFTQQASCFKGMLMIQSSEEYQMNNFYEWRSEVLRFNRELTMEEKRAALNISKSIYPLVSYLGSITLGEYDRYLKSVNITLDIGGGIGMIAYSLGDRLFMSLEMSEKKRAFFRNLTDELDALGISYAVE